MPATLLEQLKNLHEHGPVLATVGICKHLTFYSDSDRETLKDLFLCWPHSTGSAAFPIPVSKSNRDYLLAITSYKPSTQLWDRVRRTALGTARVDDRGAAK